MVRQLKHTLSPPVAQDKPFSGSNEPASKPATVQGKSPECLGHADGGSGSGGQATSDDPYRLKSRTTSYGLDQERFRTGANQPNNTLFVSGKFATLVDGEASSKPDGAQGSSAIQLHKAEVEDEADVANLGGDEDTVPAVQIEISQTLEN